MNTASVESGFREAQRRVREVIATLLAPPNRPQALPVPVRVDDRRITS